MVPVKNIFVFIVSVLIVSSLFIACKNDAGDNVRPKIGEAHAKRLIVGKWTLVGTQCAYSGVCYKKVSNNIDNITFGKDGAYFVGEKSFSYRIKNDFLYMDYGNSQCKFKYVFLDDDTLLYGALSNLQKFVRIQ